MNIRPLTPEDKDWLDKSVAADQWHADAGLTGDHWNNGIVYEDASGPLMVIKSTPYMQIDIQFCGNRLANARAFRDGVGPMMKLLKDKGYAGIIAQPISPAVRRMLTKYKFQSLEEFRFTFPEN